MDICCRIARTREYLRTALRNPAIVILQLVLTGSLAGLGSGCASAEPAPVVNERGAVGDYPMEIVSLEIPLRDEMHFAHQPVSTDSDTAQAYHDQGLTYLQAYEGLEAARSFHAALRHDSELALAWLGLSDAYIRLRDREAAIEALELAEAHSETAETERERDWLKLRGEFRATEDSFSDWDEAERDDFLERLEAAAERHPQAPEFRYFLGRLSSGEESVAWHQEILSIDTDHPGAHHELTHAFERKPEKVSLAVYHGERLAKLASQSAHAVHMFGHNAGRVGRMDDAVAAFEAADRIERSLAEEGVPLEHIGHHTHNLSFLALALYHQGENERLDAVLERLQAQSEREDHDMRRLMAPVLEANLRMGQGNWERLDEIASEVEDEEAPGAGVLAKTYRSVVALGECEINTARSHFDEAQDRMEEKDLPNQLRRPKLIPQAVLAMDDGDDALFEEALEQFADDSNPHLWIRAHPNLDALAELLVANGHSDKAARARAVLAEHDPFYRGGEAAGDGG